jgi:hypothetical protein
MLASVADGQALKPITRLTSRSLKGTSSIFNPNLQGGHNNLNSPSTLTLLAKAEMINLI